MPTNVDTFLMLGDDQLNGIPYTAPSAANVGVQPIVNLLASIKPNAWFGGRANWRYLRFVPGGITPGGGSLPWWDGQYLRVASGQGGVVDGGLGDSSSGSVLTDAGQSWTTNEHVGRYVDIIDGAGMGQKFRITANTATTLTVAGTFGTPIDGLTKYSIVGDVATGGGTNFLDDTTNGAFDDDMVGARLHILNGPGAGESKRITATTSTRLTVDSAWDTPPTSASTYEVKGSWVVYYTAPNGNIISPLDRTGGSAWYMPNRNDHRWHWGSDASTIQSIYDSYGATPFKFFKYATQGGFGTGQGSAPWKFGEEGWDNFTAQWEAAREFALNNSAIDETLVPKCVFVNIGYEDIAGATALTVLALKSDIESWISNMRTYLGDSELKFVFVVPHPDTLKVSQPTTANFVAAVFGSVSAEDENVGLVQAGNYEVEPQAYGEGRIDQDPKFLESEAYLDIGSSFWGMYQSLVAGETFEEGTGIRAYLFLGNSQTVGTLHFDYANYGDQPRLIGGSGGATPQARIWTGSSLDNYVVETTSNPLVAEGQTSFGPELTFYEDQVLKHPTETIALLKYGKNGAALVTESGFAANLVMEKGVSGGMYQTILDEWTQMKSVVLTQEGLTSDCHGIFLCVGDNDFLSVPVAEAFAVKLPLFIANLQDDFKTRVGGKKLPIVLVQVHADSVNGDAEGKAIVRAAISAAASLDQVSVVNIDDQELRNTDSVHHGGECIYYVGRQASAAIDSLSLNVGGGAGSSSVGSDTAEDDGGEIDDIPGAGTLIVETGSGLPDAESYVDPIEAQYYIDRYYPSTTWDNALPEEQENWLRQATEWGIDGLYYGVFRGGLAKPWEGGQRLQWPRIGAYDDDGRPISSGVVPERIKIATALLAAMLAEGEELLPDELGTDKGALIEETKKADGVGSKTLRYSDIGGRSTTIKRRTRAEAQIYPLVRDDLVDTVSRG